jgi:hypothetical protein
VADCWLLNSWLLNLVLLNLVLLNLVSGVSGLGNRGGLQFDSSTDQRFARIASGFGGISAERNTTPHLGDKKRF